MKKLLLTQVLLLLALCSNAQQVSVDEARTRAMNFLQSSRAHRAPVKGTNAATSSVELAYTSTRDTDQKVCFYVFNEGQNDGFVIVGGDESAEEILGYSTNGSFDYATAPDNFKWWLSQYKQQISVAMDYAEANPQAFASAKAKAARKAASNTKTDIAQKLTTQWNQDSPFSDDVNDAFYAQTGINVDFATGCVATAMAQVLYYHHIDGASGSATGTTRNYNISGTTYSFTPTATFGDYDWDNMLAIYSGDDYTSAQGAAVAKLLYHAGVSVDMKYNSSSSAALAYVPNAFASYFGYDQSIRHVDRDYYGDTDWEDMIYNELKTNGPVLYGGQDVNGNGGHAFVCDGYRATDNMFHINWGWAGYCDSYFLLTGTGALYPGGSGAGGAGMTAEYSDGQEAIINVKAASTNLETPVLRFNGLEEYLDETFMLSYGTTTTRAYEHSHGTSTKLTLSESIANFSRNLTTFTLGIKATDTTTGLEYIFPSSNTATLTYLQYKTLTADFDVNELPYNGTYEINMVGRNTNSTSDDDWYEVEIETGIAKPTVTVTGATDPTKTDVEFAISSKKVEVSRTIQVSHPTAYKGTITYTSSNESVATVDDNGVVTGVAEGTATITASAEETTYFNATTQSFDITVTSFVKGDADVTISATGLAVGETAQITISGGYDGTATYASTDATVASVADGVVTANKLGTATITVTLPETEKYNAKTATFDIVVTDDEIYLTETPYFENDNNPWSGDALLHYSIKNNSSSNLVYFLTKLYVGDDLIGCEGTSISSNSKTIISTFDINDYYSTELKGKEGTQFTLKFFKSTKNNWSDPYNIPSITFTYRSELNTSVSSGKYSTIILPMDVKTLPEGMQVYSCNGKKSGSATLELVEQSSIAKNTPYIIYYTDPNSENASYTFNGYPDINDAGNVTVGALTGMLKAATVPAGSYVLQTQDNVQAFYQVESAATGKANRCYLTLSSGAKALYFNENDGEETAISALSSLTNDEMEAIYTANGTKVSSLQKGMNIVKMKDGSVRKILVK